MKNSISLIGNRYGRWLVIDDGGKNKNRLRLWKCKCDCGNIRLVAGVHLLKGYSKSCGCYKRDLTIARNTSHNQSRTRLYRIWAGMKDRCYNPNATKYHRYGARGIVICDDWLNSFESFHDWAISSGYTDGLTIDRINNNGDYCPKNCRWATNEEQCNNRGHHILLEINGETKTVAQWAKVSGVNYATIYARHFRGWTGESLIRKV